MDFLRDSSGEIVLGPDDWFQEIGKPVAQWLFDPHGFRNYDEKQIYSDERKSGL